MMATTTAYSLSQLSMMATTTTSISIMVLWLKLLLLRLRLLQQEPQQLCLERGCDYISYYGLGANYHGFTGKKLFLLGPPAWSVTKIRPGKNWFGSMGKFQTQKTEEDNSVVYSNNTGVDSDHEGGDCI